MEKFKNEGSPVPPGNTIFQQQPGPVQPAATMPQALPKKLAPHNFIALAIFVAVCFGITNIVTLFCSIPAIVFSLLSYTHNERAQYKNGKLFAHLSVGFTTTTIVYGMLSIFIGFFISTLFNFYERFCLSGEDCRFLRII